MSPRASPTFPRPLHGAGDPVAIAMAGMDRTPATPRAQGPGPRAPQKEPPKRLPARRQVPRPTLGTMLPGVLGTAGGTAGATVVSASVGLVILGFLNRFHPRRQWEAERMVPTGRCWTRPWGEEPGDDGSGGDFSPARVAQELRNQFPEAEVRRRDHGRRYQGFLGDIPEEADEDLEIQDNTTAELMDEGMTAEGAALVVDAEAQAQEAMAALHQARRTLRDARQRQQQVKQSWKYYTSGAPGRNISCGSSDPARDDSQLDCLGGEPQQAPFVCYLHPVDTETEEAHNGFAQEKDNEDHEQAYHSGLRLELPTTQEAAREGMAVIDGVWQRWRQYFARTFATMARAASRALSRRGSPRSPSGTPLRTAV